MSSSVVVAVERSLPEDVFERGELKVELGDVSLARDAEITRRMLLVRARAQGQVSRLEESIDMPIVKIEQRASSHLTVEEVGAIGIDCGQQLEGSA